MSGAVGWPTLSLTMSASSTGGVLAGADACCVHAAHAAPGLGRRAMPAVWR